MPAARTRLRSALVGVGLLAVLGGAVSVVVTDALPSPGTTQAAGAVPVGLPPVAARVAPAAVPLGNLDFGARGEDTPPRTAPTAPTAPAAPAAPSVVPLSTDAPPAGTTGAAQQAATAEVGGTVPALAPLPLPGYAKEPPASSSVAPLRGTLKVSATPGGKALRTLTSPTDKGAPLALLVLEHGTGTATGWDRVALEQRPNGTDGWVRAVDVTETANPWRITVLQGRHRVLVWYGHSLMGDQPVAVGAPATPTPVGVTYVDVLVDTGNPYGSYGRWILGLAAHSDVYTTFGANDGDALIGLHGTDERDSIGHSVSHGCVRMPNAFAAELAHVIPLGTRVSIEA